MMLERNNFISNLIKAKSIKGIYKVIKKTPYEKIIEKGLQEFEKSGEIFQLENELDKYNNLDLKDYDLKIKARWKEIFYQD